MVFPASDYPQFDQVLRVQEAADILKVSRSTIFRMVEAGELPALHFGGKTIRIRAKDLQDFINRK